MAAAAAVAFRLAAEREAACQQGCCQHANYCSHWTSHHLNWKENAISGQKAHYFLAPGLYWARELVLAGYVVHINGFEASVQRIRLTIPSMRAGEDGVKPGDEVIGCCELARPGASTRLPG